MKVQQRIDGIDQFRGLAIVLMVVANYCAGIIYMPPFLLHAPDIGFTIIDLIAPLFIVAIGFTYGRSWSRRTQKDGTGTAILHFVRRYATLIGIGAVFAAGEQLFHVSETLYSWGVLQSLGAAGLICLLVIGLDMRVRLAIGVLLLVVYQILCDGLWLQTILHSSHGGLYGTLSWGAMLIITTAIADYYQTYVSEQKSASGRSPQHSVVALAHAPKRIPLMPGEMGAKPKRPRSRKKKHHQLFLHIPAIAGGSLLAIGLLLQLFIPISKNRVSSSYVLVCTGLGILLLVLFLLVSQRWGMKLSFLRWWGKNPFLFYIIHQILLGLVVLPGVPMWYTQAPVWLVCIQLIVLVGSISVMAWWMDRRNIIISL